MTELVITEPAVNQEIGDKLANFRKKLGRSIGQKKITQVEFGEMFGVLSGGAKISGRAIASYELGKVALPIILVYNLWKQGNSIDNILNDGEITPGGKESAERLFALTAKGSLTKLDKSDRDRLEKELADVPVEPAEKTTPAATPKRKIRHTETRKTKKR